MSPISETSNEPALLVTCKQIRKEALEIYYSTNTFRLRIVDGTPIGRPFETCVEAKTQWLTAIGAHRSALVDRLEIGYESLPHVRDNKHPLVGLQEMVECGVGTAGLESAMATVTCLQRKKLRLAAMVFTAPAAIENVADALAMRFKKCSEAVIAVALEQGVDSAERT